MRMKILIIGSKGMLGTDIVSEISKTENEVIGWDISDIDITKEEDMSKIEKESPSIIINCAAYTDVDKAEEERERCCSINVTGVKNLVDICKKLNIPLIQISTDYVFNGEKEGYDEDNKKNPINSYGQTKAEGEDLIIDNLKKYYIIRTAWLFGKNGKNFVETMLKLFKEKEEIKVVDDQVGCPTYTKDLAKAIINLIEKDYGIYHITNSGKCSWFEFAEEIKRLTTSNCIIHPCKTKEFPRPAKRPKFSILNNNKIENLQDWKDSLQEYLKI
ncbi:dTDP-4-dehydrorhamnose reductase [Candidatus Woesearchaeota archaeon]|nr:dTDP-4-dehydrorhamnose reductase [Candidatus Woesearchaeota archaeon]